MKGGDICSGWEATSSRYALASTHGVLADLGGC